MLALTQMSLEAKLLDCLPEPLSEFGQALAGALWRRSPGRRFTWDEPNSLKDHECSPDMPKEVKLIAYFLKILGITKVGKKRGKVPFARLLGFVDADGCDFEVVTQTPDELAPENKRRRRSRRSFSFD